jgi:hypothetical protein
MPYEYTHENVTVQPHKDFVCDLACAQCEAVGLNGARCRRRVCIWLPYCWQHAKADFGVAVAPSKVLPGSTGMYATRDFARNEMIVPYGGETLHEREVIRRYGTGPLSVGPYLLGNTDSACRRYVASAANGAFGTIPRERSNAMFRDTAHRVHGDQKGPPHQYRGYSLTRGNLGIKKWLVATDDLRQGDEIVADYGDADEYSENFMRRNGLCQRKECDTTRYKRRK